MTRTISRYLYLALVLLPAVACGQDYSFDGSISQVVLKKDLPHRLELAQKNAAKVHQADAETILQACIFEIVSLQIDQIPITVEELKVGDRGGSCESMRMPGPEVDWCTSR